VTSYSQYSEDVIFVPLLEKCQTKRLLDIGAWDAKTFSNSRALIEMGWSAVLFEPSPGPLRNLAREYDGIGRVRIVGAAVTVHGGLVDLKVTDDAVSQPDNSVKQEWLETGGFYGVVTMPSLAVADLFAQFGGDFEFCSFDSEGTSCDLFFEMLRVGPRPRCVIVEHDNRIVELNQYAEAAHYRQVHINGTNWVGIWSGKRE
jgi:hypothetical protein